MAREPMTREHGLADKVRGYAFTIFIPHPEASSVLQQAADALVALREEHDEKMRHHDRLREAARQFRAELAIRD